MFPLSCERSTKITCSNYAAAAPGSRAQTSKIGTNETIARYRLRSVTSWSNDRTLRMIRNVLICTTQVPFTTGGGESHVEGLRQALIAAGYNAEVAALPFKWYPPTEIMRGALAWRMLDVSEANGKPIDLVIGMKFPAYLVGHPKKVLWVMHQYRSAYNLWGTQFDDLSTYPEGPRVRQWIRDCDNRFLNESRKVFANSQTVAQRLQHFNHIASEVL